MNIQTDTVQPNRFAVWLAPLIALLWLAALTASAGVLILSWKFVKFAWGL